MEDEAHKRYPKGYYLVKIIYDSGHLSAYYIANLVTGFHASFFTLWDLIKSIENDISVNRFPQCGIKYRTWDIRISSLRKASVDKKDHYDVSIGAMLQPEKHTFIICVQSRQNATWQGTVKRIDCNQTCSYRSLNELLFLLDEAVC